MAEIVTIGQTPWTWKDMTARLEEFAILYKKRPLEKNTIGMHSPHMFLSWFVLNWLQPPAIIESGVAHGQGTWFFAQACPNAKLYCIDPRPDFRIVVLPQATYFEQDFGLLDWSNVSKDALVFFDDHQNALDRIGQCKRWGFKRMMFEDNYAVGGDCHSLKKAFLDPAQNQYLRQNLRVYEELPPVFKPTMTRGNVPWPHGEYPTPEPLLTTVEEPWQQIFLDEASHYTWLCYVELA